VVSVVLSAQAWRNPEARALDELSRPLGVDKIKFIEYENSVSTGGKCAGHEETCKATKNLEARVPSIDERIARFAICAKWGKHVVYEDNKQ